MKVGTRSRQGGQVRRVQFEKVGKKFGITIPMKNCQTRAGQPRPKGQSDELKADSEPNQNIRITDRKAGFDW